MAEGKKQAFARAIVEVKLEITSHGHWGEEATVKEVMERGSVEALNALRNMIEARGAAKGNHFKIVGEPTVSAVTWRQT